MIDSSTVPSLRHQYELDNHTSLENITGSLFLIVKYESLFVNVDTFPNAYT